MAEPVTVSDLERLRDPDLRAILAAAARAQAKHRRGAMFVAALMVFCVVVAVLRDQAELALFAGLFFATLSALLFWAARKNERSPALRALVERPSEVVRVKYVETSD